VQASERERHTHAYEERTRHIILIDSEGNERQREAQEARGAREEGERERGREGERERGREGERERGREGEREGGRAAG
jgi:hypothetical protein